MTRLSFEKDLRSYHDGSIIDRLEAALRHEDALKKAEEKYLNESGIEPKGRNEQETLLMKRIANVESAPKTWDEKGAEWKARRETEKVDEEKQQAQLSKKVSRWAESLEEEFEEGGEE